MTARLDIQAIKSSIDVVSYVARFVALKRSGRAFLGLCPFHAEKTPSFRVDPERGFYCHGCAAGGDIVSFVMRVHELDFVAATKLLAHEVGLSPDTPLDSSTRRRLEQQDRARRARKAAVDGLRQQWRSLVAQLDDVRERAYVAEAALRFDPQRSLAITEAILAEYGDAIAERSRLELALEAVDERERELRDRRQTETGG